MLSSKRIYLTKCSFIQYEHYVHVRSCTWSSIIRLTSFQSKNLDDIVFKLMVVKIKVHRQKNAVGTILKSFYFVDRRKWHLYSRDDRFGISKADQLIYNNCWFYYNTNLPNLSGDNSSSLPLNNMVLVVLVINPGVRFMFSQTHSAYS